MLYSCGPGLASAAASGSPGLPLARFLGRAAAAAPPFLLAAAILGGAAPLPALPPAPEPLPLPLPAVATPQYIAIDRDRAR